MATLKEKRHDKGQRWIGSGQRSNVKLTLQEQLDCEDVKGEYDPELEKSLTVPGQSKSIKEMMDRYEKGRPLPVE